MIMALMATDLPEPVEPAMRMRPLMSLPRAMASLDRVLAKDSDSTTSRSQMVSRSWLGTWIPTVDLPAMRSMRMDSAAMARQRSSARPVTREYLTPASGWNSNVVTMGPGLIWVTWPLTPNSAHFWTRVRASARRASSRTTGTSSERKRSEEGGSLYPRMDLGVMVTCLMSASAR